MGDVGAGLIGLVAVVLSLGIPMAGMYTYFRVKKLKSEERMAAIARYDSPIIGVVNVGVPESTYTTIGVPDTGVDRIGSQGARREACDIHRDRNGR